MSASIMNLSSAMSNEYLIGTKKALFNSAVTESSKKHGFLSLYSGQDKTRTYPVG
jgi:hypothetical protein